MRHASIDIGTNTLRLLVADSGETGIKPVRYCRLITRLGGKYREDTGIDAASAERTFDALADFRKEMDALEVVNVSAVATSVVRRASNRDWFLTEAERRAGVRINMISGDEEAALSLLGVLSVINDTAERRLVIDIGGGSTEFIFTDFGNTVAAFSMEMGVVHLSERHLKSDPPMKLELENLNKEVCNVMHVLKTRASSLGMDADAYSSKNSAVLIGTAGTITTLAALDQNLDAYDSARINNYRLTKAKLTEIFARLCSLTLKEREGLLSLEKGREDLIIAGTAIALKVMDSFGFDELKVSDAGLLEGLILRDAAVDALI